MPNVTASANRANTRAAIKFPSLWQPGAAQDSESCAAPRVKLKHQPAQGQRTFWEPRLSPEVLAYARATVEEHAATIVPEEQRPWLRENLSLRQAYEDWVFPDELARVQRGAIKRASLEKDLQALNRWETFSRPDDWPADRAWPGLPVGFITPKVLDRFLARLFRAEAVATGTARSTWTHLRSILNRLTRVRALDVCPKPTDIPSVEDEGTEWWRPEQVERGYRALKALPALQVAFVLAHNAGPRTGDLFCLRWDDVELDGPRPRLSFFARKTRKTQTIPLAPITVAHLRRLRSREHSLYLFPGCTAPETKEPEKSPAARNRRQEINQLFRSQDLIFKKPFQALRKTCNTILETYRTDAGQFVLGHKLTLNAKHYFEPSDLVFDAIASVPQPPCFSDF